MGGVSRSELVAAVSDAGGFGFLGMVREPPELITSEVERLRQLGHRGFGVNIIPAATDPALLERQITTCIELAVPVVGTFWDLDARVTKRLRDAELLVVHQVGSVDEAIEAERAGVSIIIVQGNEAGGHVRGTQPLRELLPEVVATVSVPVLAAGGLTTGTDLMTAMALGADGIVVGTAMLATSESFAHSYHKHRLLDAAADDTVLTTSFHINWPSDAPVRVLKSAVTSGAHGDPHSTSRTVIGAEAGRPIYLFSTDSPLRSTTGDFDSMALYAGTGVEHITQVTGAGDRIRAIVAQANDLRAMTMTTNEETELSSPVCYLREMTGSYTGVLSAEELSSELWMLADVMQTALRVALLQKVDHTVSSQPPFADTMGEFASWSLLLQHLLGGGGRGRFRTSNDIPLQRLKTLDTTLIRAALLRRLSRIVPRVAQSSVRDQLTLLRSFVEAHWPDPFGDRPQRTATDEGTTPVTCIAGYHESRSPLGSLHPQDVESSKTSSEGAEVRCG